MKQVLFVLSCLLFAVCSCQSSKVVINGIVDGLADTDTINVVLYHFDGEVGKQYMLDTLDRGRFHFELDTLPSGNSKYCIGLFSKHAGIPEVLCLCPELYLEPGAHVHMKGIGKYYYTARISSPVKDQKLRQRILGKMSQKDWEHFQDLYVDRYAVVNNRMYGSGLSSNERDSLYRLSEVMLKQSDSISILLNHQRMKLMVTEPPGQYWMDKLKSEAKGLSIGRDKEYRPIIEQLYAGLPAELRDSPVGRR